MTSVPTEKHLAYVVICLSFRPCAVTEGGIHYHNRRAYLYKKTDGWYHRLPSVQALQTEDALAGKLQANAVRPYIVSGADKKSR